MKHLTTVPFVLAVLLMAQPALAVAPTFNGDNISATMPAFNVRWYGAKVDGSTNDSAAVQAAENACNTAGGGRVFFPAGTTKASGITFYTGCYQVGAGIGVSIVSPPNGANTTVFTSYNFAALTGTNSSSGVYHTGFIDITIDGNKANETAGDCAQIYGYILTIKDAQFQNCHSDGLYSEWGNSGTSGTDYGIMEAYLVNVRSTSNGGNGITWKGPHDSMWTHVITAENGGKGTDIGGNGTGVLANGFHSWGGSQTWALYFENGQGGNWFTNAVAEGASVGQVYFGGNNNAFVGQIYGIPVGAVGAQFGTASTQGAASNTLIATIQDTTSQTSPLVSFADDFGLNMISVTTYCPTASTPLYTGTIANSDTITWGTATCTGTAPNQIAVGATLATGTLSATSVNASSQVNSSAVVASSGTNLNLNANKTTANSGAVNINYNAGSNNNQGSCTYDGGTANAVCLAPTSGGLVFITTGTGAPTANKVAGSIYIRTDGSAGSRIYISQGGGTWIAISGV